MLPSLRPVAYAPRRLCAPSLMLIMASLVASLLLAAPDARAGSYSWSGTDPTTGENIYSPAYSGGTTSEDSVTTNTHVSGQPDTLDTRPSPPTYGGISNVFCYPAANGSATSSTASGGGAISAQFTWKPAFTGDLPPTAAIIQENSSVTMGWSYSGGASLTGTDSTGFGQSGTISGTTGSNVTIAGTNYSGCSGGNVISAPACSVSASQSGGSGTSASGGGAQASFQITYSATVTPVTLTLTGTTPDSSGNQNILVGQGCTASISGIPAALLNNTANPPTYSWSVSDSASTFQAWSGTTPAIPPAPANANASYYSPGPGPLNNPTAHWYWDDNAATATVQRQRQSLAR